MNENNNNNNISDTFQNIIQSRKQIYEINIHKTSPFGIKEPTNV